MSQENSLKGLSDGNYICLLLTLMLKQYIRGSNNFLADFLMVQKRKILTLQEQIGLAWFSPC